MAYKDPEKRRAYFSKWRKANLAKMAGYVRAWRHKNKAKALASGKAWREANAEKFAAIKKAWRLANPDKVKAQQKRARQRNAAKIRARNRAYQQANPDKCRAWNRKHYHKDVAASRDTWRIYGQNRKNRERAGPGLSRGLAGRLLIAQNHVCAYCPADLRVTGYHLDHVKPLSKGGRHEDANIALACPPCNRSKHAKDPEEFRLYRCANV